ncbi:pseudouridylate synthase 4 [Moniliophthora roreri]|nr:pseudouridylate synthase 4 [Moniliophthora roreri]
MKVTPGSPSKGKLKEESSWNSGCPVEWSDSSIIFTGHGMRPVICGRYFSSSKQFILPSPPPLQTEPDSYEPVSVISVSPDDEWLFAYFPGHNVPGVCCFWKRGVELDKWTVRDWWTTPAGVVKAEWIGSGREWICDPVSGKPTRLPFRGPRTPVSTATVLLVTENRQVILCYFRHGASNFKMLSCSLSKPSFTNESTSKTETEVANDLNTVRICTSAALALNYYGKCSRSFLRAPPTKSVTSTDSFIIVATRSQKYPLPLTNGQYNPIDISAPIDLDQTRMEVLRNIPEDYEEESTIDLCAVQLNFNGAMMSLITHPLPSIHTKEAKLKDMHFAVQPKTDPAAPGGLYLVANYFEFQDYTTVPVSSVECYSLARSTENPNAWVVNQESSRKFDEGVVTFVTPCKPISGTWGVIAGVYWKSGTQPRASAKLKETPVGSLHILSIPTLTNDEEWETSPILKASDKPGQDVCINVIASPNNTLLCTVSASVWTTQTSLQGIPQRKLKMVDSLSAALVAAILSQRATTDISHQLSHHSLSSNVISDVLVHCFSVLDDHHKASARTWIQQVGVCLETYRLKASRTTHKHEREEADARWQIAHDICSLTACNLIFEECKEGEDFNTDAVWQLVDVSTWIMAFLEKMMRECILQWDLASSAHSDGELNREIGLPKSTNSLIFSDPSDIPPDMLHFAHPQASRNVLDAVMNVKKFREFLGALTARSENSQIAKDVLIDQVDCSGIDLAGVIPILNELHDSLQTVDAASQDALAQDIAAQNSGQVAHIHKTI